MKINVARISSLLRLKPKFILAIVAVNLAVIAGSHALWVTNAADTIAPVPCTNGIAQTNVIFDQDVPFPGNYNLISQTTTGLVNVTINFGSGVRYQNPENCTGGEFLLTYEADVTLPSFLEIVSLEQNNPYIESISSNGGTVSVRLRNVRHPLSPAPTGTRAGVVTRIKAGATVPANATLSSYSVRFNGNYPTLGSIAATNGGPVGMLYTKIDLTSTRTEPVGPGDEIEYRMTTRQYPHFTTTASRVNLTIPANTDFVAGSLTGTAGTVTQTSSAVVVDFGPNPGRRSFSYRVRVKPTIPTNAVEIVHFPSYIYSVQNEGFNGGEPRIFPKTDAVQHRIPIKPTLKLEWTATGTKMDLNGELLVKVKLTNLSTTTAMTNARLGTRTFQGEGLATFVTPDPAGVSLAPGESREIQYRLLGTRLGKFQISAPANASSSIGNFATIAQLSPEFCVGCADVELDIETPTERIRVGDTFPARVKVTSNLPDPTTITFANPVLKENPAGGLPANKILTVEPPAFPAPFALTPESRTRTFTAMVRADRLGVSDLASSLTFTKPGSNPETLTKTRKVEISPFVVTVQVTPKNSALNNTPAERKTQRCRELEAASSLNANCIEIVARVRNDGSLPITNVTIPDANDPLRLINETNPEIFGEPLRLIESNLPQGPITLEAGAEAVWTWRMAAYDAPTHLEFVAIARGVLNGAEVSGNGKQKFKIAESVILKWGMRPTDGRTNYPSGSVIRADGYIENVSAANGGEGKLLRVLVYPMPDKNAGGGFVRKSTYNGPTPNDYEFFDLPFEGPGKRVELKAAFRTMRTIAASSGKAGFGVRVAIVEDNGDVTNATEQAQLDDDYTDEFFAFLSPEQFTANQYVEDCLAVGFPPLLCSFNEGFSGEFVDGMHGLMQFTLYSLEKTGEGGVRTGAYTMWAIKEVGKTVLGDPQAKAALMQDLHVQYLTFHNLKMMGGQTAGQLPMALEEFSNQTFDAMGRFFLDIERGDLTALQEKTGHFLGANPDLLFEVFAVSRGITKLSSQLKDTSGNIADNITTVTVRDKAIREASEAEARIAAADANPNVTDLSTALATGDELTPSLLRKVFGVSDDVAKKLHDFAKKNNVILAFRSRSQIAQTLLDAALAWPKPQILKFKTVNEIDMRFLGYRRRAEGLVEIVEPPPGILGKEGRELKEACDAYMDVLVSRNPELAQNRVLRAETRKRLETRAKEWNKYVPSMKLNNLNADVKVGVSFDGKMQWARDVSGDIGIKEYRKIERVDAGTITDQVTNQPRRVWEIKMEGPNGAQARPVTGDIDFLGILDKYGRFINDDDKRIALYVQLQEWMEHGESMSFRYEGVRLENLRCCTDGAEAMVTVGPWEGPPRAGRFVDNYSVVDEFNATFKRVRGIEPTPGPAGELQYDADGKLIGTTIRMENPNGEFALVNGIPLLNKADEIFERTFAPLIFEVVYQEFLTRLPYYFPGLIERLLNDDDRPGSDAPATLALFRRGGPLLQLERVSAIELREPTELTVWTAAAGWQPISRQDAIAAGDPTLRDIAPNSPLRDNAAQGTFRLAISSLEQLGATGDFFAAGDTIVIDPGGPRQETAAIVSMNPLTLAQPLVFDHVPGEIVAVVGQTGPTPTPTATPTGTPTPTVTPTVTPTPAPVGFEGDVVPRPNGDGNMLSTDITQIRRFVSGLDTPNPSTNEAQRIDCAPRATFGDGIINSSDVVQGRRYVSGLDTLTPAGGPASRGGSVPESVFIQNIDGGMDPFQRELRIGEPQLRGSTAVVPIELTPEGNEVAMSFTLEYDPNLLTNPRITLGEFAPIGSTLTVNSTEPGRIGILIDSSNAMIASSLPLSIVSVSFDAKEEASGEAPIYLTGSLAAKGISDAFGNSLLTTYLGGVVRFDAKMN